MADGDAASHTHSNPDVGENVTIPLNDEETSLSPRGERLMKRLTTFIQQAMEQQKYDVEKQVNDKGKEKVTGGTSKPKTDRASFKAFRSSGATEFTGFADPVVAIQWLQNTEKVFRITRVWDEDKVNYATAMFTDRALTWWDATYESLSEDVRDNMTWESFKTRFHDQYCPADLQRRLEKEFLELKQGNLSVIEYETQFNQKARFALRFLTSERDRVDHFIDGLRREIRDFVANRDIPDFNRAVEYARRREHDLTRRDDDPIPSSKRQRIEGASSVPVHRPSRFSNLRRTHSQTTPRTSSQAFSLQVYL